MVIDTVFEWLVVGGGAFLMFSVWFPGPINAIGRTIKKITPKPEEVNKWLKRIGY